MKNKTILAFALALMLMPSVLALSSPQSTSPIHKLKSPDTIDPIKKPTVSSPNGDFGSKEITKDNTGTSSGSKSGSSSSGGGSCITQLDSEGYKIDLLSKPIRYTKDSNFDMKLLSRIYKGMIVVEEGDDYVIRQFVLNGNYCVAMDENMKVIRNKDIIPRSSPANVNNVLPINWWIQARLERFK